MNKPRQPLSQQQIDEWIENPVTIYMREWAEYELNEIEGTKGINAFHPFEAHKTQEIMAGLNGCADTWNLVIDALKGEIEMEIEYDEQ